MKKFLFVVSIFAIASMSLNAAWKFPGWGKDAAVYEAEIARYDAAEPGSKPFSSTEYTKLKLGRALVGRTGLVFSEYLAAARQVADNDALVAASLSSLVVNRFWSDVSDPANIDLIKAFYRWCCDNSVKYAGYLAYVKNIRKALGITNDEAIERIAAGIPKWAEANSPADHVDKELVVMYDLMASCTLTDERQLAILKKLNRLLSARLVGKDKESWEPVIAKLRTVIASY